MDRHPKLEPGTTRAAAPRTPSQEAANIARLAELEGRQVSVALDDGSRIDDCQLVSGGRQGVATLWLFTNGTDRFVPLKSVVEVWEVGCPARIAATVAVAVASPE